MAAQELDWVGYFIFYGSLAVVSLAVVILGACVWSSMRRLGAFQQEYLDQMRQQTEALREIAQALTTVNT
jgi:hypothetical protein